MNTLPSYDTVRSETNTALQAIVDALPEGAEVIVNSTDRPYPCGEGAFFTGSWSVAIPEEFDVRAFVDGLPETVGEGFERDSIEAIADDTVNLVATGYGGTSISASDVSTDTEAELFLLATSRCAQRPAETD